MGDQAEHWEAHEEIRRSQKEENLQYAIDILRHNDILYTEHNNGYHFKITKDDYIVDFWPTTSKFYDASTGHKGVGLSSLLIYIGAIEPGEYINETRRD